MYLWTAIDVDEPLEKLREKVAWAAQKAGIPNTALTLPLHISLKISFPSAAPEVLPAASQHILPLPLLRQHPSITLNDSKKQGHRHEAAPHTLLKKCPSRN